MAELPEYTARDVAKHTGPKDVWMVINGYVYDVSSYLPEHPGGLDVLVEAAGTDATEAFDNAGHSEDALEIMARPEYCIGKLKSSGRKTATKPVKLAAANSDSTAAVVKGTDAKQLARWTALSLGTVGASYAFHRFTPGLSSPPMNSLPALPWPSAKRGVGFTEGILVGAGVIALVNAVLAQKMMSLIKGEHKSFMDYPPHIKYPKRAKQDLLNRRGWLDPVTYYPLPLTKKVQLSPNVYKLTFDLPTPQAVIGLPTGQHVAIKAEVDGEVITRSYTPVSNNSDLGVLELVIKVYPDGKLTNGYLAKLEVGDEVMFRGPKGAMRYTSGHCKKIGMLAGGTGITPMFQLIRAICESETDTTEISLIYANRTEEDILLREELDTYARRYPKNLKVHYLLDKPPTGWTFGSGFVTKEMMAERFPAPNSDTKIMLCGPPGMVKAAKESLASLGYEKPGAMAKASDQVFLF